MNKKTLLFIILSLFINWSYGQISEGGMPKSFKLKNISQNFEEVTVKSLEPSSISKLISENEKDGGFYKNGKILPANFNLENNGTWTILQDGSKIWRLKITSLGAKALVLYYDNFFIPDGGKLYLYNESKTQTIGAFTKINNSENGRFVTEMIQGESVTLEYFQPSQLQTSNSQLPTPIISINQLAYIYRATYFPSLKNVKNFGDSDTTCQVNANCSPEGDSWQDQKKGVVRIFLTADSITGWCSGSVVNNIRQDFTPYILTADHCAEGATTAELNDWIFYFNYEAPSCAEPTSEGTLGSQTMTGCTKIANGGDTGDAGSDFYLVRLTANIPENFTPYFNGWDSRDNAPTSGVSIHHPAGDIKKISKYNSTLTTTGWNGSAYNSHWRVPWVSTTNGFGVTEGGSSGSPLFDQNKRIVGDLTGGGSYCTATDLPDYYGKFSYSWLSNGTADTARLKPWLDPDNTGTQFVDGSYYLNANFTQDITTVVVTGKVTFTNTSAGSPTSWKWIFAGGTPASSSLQNPPTQIQYNTIGTYDVTLIVTKGALTDTLKMPNLINVIKPYADFYENQTNILVSRYVTFTDTSFGSPTTWNWTFVGGTPSTWNTKTPPPIQYNSVGVFDVKLIVTKGTYKDTLLKPNLITVVPPEIHAYFDVNRDSVAQFQAAKFIDTSFCDTTIVSWEWTFEGGTPATSSLQVPLIQYDSLGYFDVSLKVCSEWGCDSISKTNYITVVPVDSTKVIKANFLANKTLVNLYEDSVLNIFADSLVKFTDYSYSEISDWEWTFNGAIPSSSSLQNPDSIKYLISGKYDVKLVVLNPFGTDTLIRTQYIEVSNGITTSPPIAKFTVNRHLIQEGENVNFTDLSYGAGGLPKTWTWEFEGATPSSSTDQHPLQILYSNYGIYRVSLTVTNMVDTSTKSIDQFIFVSSQPVISPNTCDTIVNYSSSENGSEANQTQTISGGYMSGHNSLNVTEFADYFDHYIYSQINGLIVYVYKAVAGNANSKVIFKIWSVGSNGLPETVLGSKEVNLNSMSATYAHFINFDEPVDVFGSFFAGYEISYTYTDVFATYLIPSTFRTEPNDLGILNSLYLKQNNSWISSTSLYSYNTSSIMQPISCIVGTQEISSKNSDLLIFPNPSNGSFNIFSNSSALENSEIIVYNMFGEKVSVSMQKQDNFNISIDFNGNSSGIYFVNIITDNSLITRKISYIK